MVTGLQTHRAISILTLVLMLTPTPTLTPSLILTTHSLLGQVMAAREPRQAGSEGLGFKV